MSGRRCHDQWRDMHPRESAAVYLSKDCDGVRCLSWAALAQAGADRPRRPAGFKMLRWPKHPPPTTLKRTTTWVYVNYVLIRDRPLRAHYPEFWFLFIF